MAACESCGRENPSDARYCNGCGELLTVASARGGVRKTVTILFCDLVGSTEMGDRLDPEVLRATMTRFFGVAAPLIERYGGTVEKFIGDAVVAVFGAPVAHEDDAFRAVRAAHELRRELGTLEGVRVRIGVATGEAMTGVGQTLGSGDVFNLASRLQTAADPGEVLLADATHRRVSGAVLAEALMPLTLKGKTDGVQAWRLVAVRGRADAIPRRFDVPLVGRQSELLVMRAEYERCVGERRCRVVTVLGEAGVGKSRLVAELTASISDADCLVGHCLAYGQGITLWPVAEMVRAAAEILESDDRNAAAGKIASVVEGPQARRAADRVAEALGFTEAGGGEEFDWAVRRVFECRAAVRPQLLVFEDVHWAEPALLDLIEYLARWSRTAPMLMVCLARPEFLDQRQGWSTDPCDGRTVWLERLTDDDCHRLVREVAPTLEAEACERVVERAEGNPLFAEQMAAMLVGDPDSDEIPASVGALLQARIDHLDSDMRVVAAAAAVEGRVFHRSAVAELVPDHARGRVGEHLLGLMRSKVIRPAAGLFGGEDAYQFSHTLVRDAAYDALPKQTRSDLHERFAAWLETRAGSRVGEYEEIVGYHLEQAYKYRTELGPVDERAREVARQAALHLLSSAERAQSRGNIEAAQGLLERCLKISTATEHARTLVLLAETVAALGQYSVALPLAIEAGDAAAELEDTRLALRAQLTRIVARTHTDLTYTNTQAQHEVEQLLAKFEAHGDRQGRNRTLVELGRLAWYDGQVGRTFKISQRMCEHASQMSPRDRTSIALGLFSGAYEGSMSLDERFVALAQARAVLGEGALGEAVISTFMSAILGLGGRFDEARRCATRAWQAWVELGNPVRRTMSFEIIGNMERLAGNFYDAARLFRQGLGILMESKETLFSASAAVNLADALCDLGRFDQAVTLVESTNNLAAAAKQDVWLEGSLRMIHARVLSNRGEHSAALKAADAAVAIREGAEYSDWHGDCHEVRGLVLAAAGRVDDARTAYEMALGSYTRGQVQPAVERIRTRISALSVEVPSAVGDPASGIPRSE